jgi:hypothetical protein
MPKKKSGAKKPRTEAQIAATKKAQEARKAKIEAAKTETPVVPQPESTPPVVPTPEPSPFSQASEEDKDKIIIALQRDLIEALKMNQGRSVDIEQVLAEKASMQPQGFNGNGVHISAQGGIQGRIVKHSLSKADYPDPTPRLYDDPRLKRHNLRENYIFTWDVEGEQYTKDGVTYAEPRFTVRLFRRLFDDNDVDTGRAALISRTMLHEDEFVAQIIADRMGLLENFSDTKEMMDEIRYHRIRDWLIPIFIPAKPEEHANRKTEMVIDGKAVEVYDTEKVIGESAADSKANTILQSVRR